MNSIYVHLEEFDGLKYARTNNLCQHGFFTSVIGATQRNQISPKKLENVTSLFGMMVLSSNCNTSCKEVCTSSVMAHPTI